MRKIIYILNLFIATVLLVGCSETLEETYDSVTDGGKIRYVAKCSKFNTLPGWERLVLEWENGTDATISEIKIVRTYDGITDSIMLPRLTTTYEYVNLSNIIYRFDITALDKDGNKSLTETTYGRPFTREHEIMSSFTRGVVKSYFVKEKMVFFSDKWNEGIIEMKLEYKTPTGEVKHYEFRENQSDRLVTVNDVSMDPLDTVFVLRKGKFENSIDEITFDPYPVSRMKIFSSGFINSIERRYGYSTETKEDEILFNKFVEEVEELEFDYDVETFEDILHCTSLKKLIFGKNRYLSADTSVFDQSKISGDIAKSKSILDKTKILLGMTVDIYGDEKRPHYFDKKLPYSTHLGYPKLPTPLEIIPIDAFEEDKDGNLISCKPSDPYAVLDNLLDDNPVTRWETTSTQKLRVYEMSMALKVDTEISGIKIAQVTYDSEADMRTPYFMPETISVQTSIDGAVWDNATYFESNIIGKGIAEVTLLKFPEGKRLVRYVKIGLRDGVDRGGNNMINLGDIVLYK